MDSDPRSIAEGLSAIFVLLQNLGPTEDLLGILAQAWEGENVPDVSLEATVGQSHASDNTLRKPMTKLFTEEIAPDKQS